MLIAAVGVIVVTAIGLLGAWVTPPRWATQRRVISLLVALLVLEIILTVLGSSHDWSPDARKGVPEPSHETTGPPSALEGHHLLAVDDSSGAPILFSGDTAGRNRNRLWDIGSDVEVVVTPDGSLLVPLSQDGTKDSGRGLALTTQSGEVLRWLTNPPPLTSDNSPSIAAGTGMVFFDRTVTTMIDDSTGTVESIGVWTVPLDGSAPARALDRPSATMLGAVSADATGSVLAGTCDNDGGPTQLCILDDEGIRPLDDKVTSTMSGAAVNEGGTMVAFSSSQRNPYGDVQVYVADLAKNTIEAVSSLPGQNDSPAWGPSASGCLTFHHAETSSETIYVACPDDAGWQVFNTGLAGNFPAWLD